MSVVVSNLFLSLGLFIINNSSMVVAQAKNELGRRSPISRYIDVFMFCALNVYFNECEVLHCEEECLIPRHISKHTFSKVGFLHDLRRSEPQNHHYRILDTP